MYYTPTMEDLDVDKELTPKQMLRDLDLPLQHINRSLAASVLPGYAAAVLAQVRYSALETLEAVAGPQGSLHPAKWDRMNMTGSIHANPYTGGPDTVVANVSCNYPKPPHVYGSGTFNLHGAGSAPLQKALRDVEPVAKLLAQLTNETRHVNGAVRYLYRLLVAREAAAAAFPVKVWAGHTFFMTRFGDWLVAHAQFGAGMPASVALVDDATWPERWAHLPPPSAAAALVTPVSPVQLLRWFGQHASG